MSYNNFLSLPFNLFTPPMEKKRKMTPSLTFLVERESRRKVAIQIIILVFSLFVSVSFQSPVSPFVALLRSCKNVECLNNWFPFCAFVPVSILAGQWPCH